MSPQLSMALPCEAVRSRARQRGVTLVEVMVALAIFAIIIVSVAPSIRAFIGNTQVRSAVESIQSGLQLARNSGLRRNENFRLSYASGNWSLVRVSDSSTVQTSGNDLRSTTISPTSFTVTFDGLGRATDGAGTIASAGLLTIAISNPTFGSCQSSGGSVRCLNIQVRSGGTSRVCDPMLAVATDPRGC